MAKKMNINLVNDVIPPIAVAAINIGMSKQTTPGLLCGIYASSEPAKTKLISFSIVCSAAYYSRPARQ